MGPRLPFPIEGFNLPGPMDLEKLFPSSARFRRVRLLGRGGMGAVYSAEDGRTGAQVALKVMLDGSASSLLRFKQEFRVVVDLSHPNLVRLFELFHEGSSWFFTMELIDGQDLRATLLGDADSSATASTLGATGDERRGASSRGATGQEGWVAERLAASGRRPPACDTEALRSALLQVVDGLEHLHRNGVTHRDLKPTNVLVGVDGCVRLADFGLASRFVPGARGGEGTAGTMPYMAPELWRGDGAGPASDRYALGCMMYELLTGQPPYERAPHWQHHGDVEVPRIEDRVEGVPPAVAVVARALISPRAADRPALDEVRAALRAPARAAARGPLPAVFVGREDERARLDEARESALAGDARAVVVIGPSGIGKTSLVALAAESARQSGFLLLEGRCHEREQMPFAALDRPVDALVDHLRPSVDDALRPHVRALCPMFPVLKALEATEATEARPPAASEAAEPGVSRAKGVRAFASLLDELQRRQPTMLFIDDLQWIDEDSASLLIEVLPRASGRLLLVLALRDDPPPRARRLIDTAARARGGSIMAVRPLAPGEVASLLERLGSLDPGRQIAVLAEGNPFIVQFVASGGPGAVGELSALIAAAMAELSPGGQDVLRLLSVLSADAPLEMVRASSELSPARFDRAVAELLASRMARTRPGGPEPRIGVYHDRIREGVDEALDPATRQELHARLGAAFERQGASVETLLYHWTMAGDSARRHRYGLLAVDEAEHKLAFARAGRLLLELLEEGQGAGSAGSWERAGDLLRLSGDVERAVSSYRRARQLQEQTEPSTGDPTPSLIRISGHLAESLVRSGQVTEGRAEWVKGQALLGLPLWRPAALRLPLLLGLFTRIWLEERRFLRATRAETAHDRAKIDFLNAQYRSLLPYWPTAAAEAGLRCTMIALQVGDATMSQRMLAARWLIAMFLQDPTAARVERASRQVRATEALAIRSGNAHELALAALGRAALLIPRDQARAAALMQQAVERFEEAGVGDSTEACMARGTRIMLLQISEEHDEALKTSASELERPHPDFVNIVFALWAKLRVHVIRGERDEARATEHRLELHLERTPPSALSATLWSARSLLAWSESRSAAALSHAERIHTATPERLPRLSAFLRALWFAPPFEPFLDLARAGRATRSATKQVTAWAHESASLPWFGHACRGHRALGLIALAQGREGDAKASLRLAVATSGTEPAYRRWLCLEAAQRLGLLDPGETAEARSLSEEGHFVLPV
jgi:eukaryotic-like serine/threonine-protein kinase